MKKRIFYPVGLLAGFLLILIFLSGPILNRAGDFLAPLSKEKAEVVILEGTETIRNGAVKRRGRPVAKQQNQTSGGRDAPPRERGSTFCHPGRISADVAEKIKNAGSERRTTGNNFGSDQRPSDHLNRGQVCHGPISERGCPKRRSGLRRVSYPQKLGGLPAGRGGIQDFSQAPPLFY